MGTEEYVAVAGDDWYQRRRQDAEGEFFRSVADQGPRKGRGGSTRQGIYCLTADGLLLAYKNAGQAPDVMRDVLQDGLEKWQKLPESRRRPAAVKIPPHGPVDERYNRTPPENGLIVNVFTRALDRKEGGELADADCQTGRGDEAARDHLWLTEAEWRSLVPAEPRVGETVPLPQRIAGRIVRFHLVDNTRGEPPHWRSDEIRSSRLNLTVVKTSPAGTELRLDGSALLSSEADAENSKRGYDVRLDGLIRYNAGEDRIDRFDLVAIGEHWGAGPYTRRNVRPGRTPLGIAFELAEENAASNAVPPQAARNLHEYFGGASGAIR